MAKKKQKFILYEDLMDYLKYESVRIKNEKLNGLFKNLSIALETSEYSLSEKQRKAKDLIEKLTKEEISDLFGELLSEKKYDKKELVDSINKEFEKIRSELLRNDDAFSEGYSGFVDGFEFEGDEGFGFEPTVSPKKNKIINLFSHKRKDSKEEFCNFDEFIETLEIIQGKNPELQNLLYSLDISSIDTYVKSNRVNQTVNSYRRYLERAFSKLTKKDLQFLLSSLQKTYGKNTSFNKNFIINEYSRRLKDKLQSISQGNEYEELSKQKKKPAKFETKTAGYTVEVKKLDPNNKKEEIKDNNKYVSTSTEKKEPKIKVGTIQQVNDSDVTSSDIINYFKADGQSIIAFIDRNFNTRILDNFFEEFKNIKTDDMSKYVEKTNKLIEDTVFYTYFPEMRKIVEAVKNTYHLEFSPIKEDNHILEEIISDELRFYQQKNIENKLDNMDTSYLGTAKRISRESSSSEGNGPKTVFEELHTTYLPHYAFTQSAFNDEFVVRTEKKELPDDFVLKHLTGSSFLSNPANAELTKNDLGEFVVTPSITSKYKI